MSTPNVPSPNTKLIAFIAGSAITLLGVLVISPLLDSEAPQPVPAIEVGKSAQPGPQPGKGKRDAQSNRERAAPELQSAADGSDAVPPAFAPAPPPSPRPEPAVKPPPAAPPPAAPPPADDDDDDDDGDDDDDDDDSDD